MNAVAKPVVQPPMTQAFLDVIEEDGLFAFQAIHKDGRVRPHYGTFKACAADLIRDNVVDGFDIFFVPNATDGQGVANENITGVRVAWVDDDNKTDVDASMVLDGAPIRFSPMVMSSPDKWHGYIPVKNWPVTGTVADAAKFKAMQNMLAAYCHSDTQVCAISNLMRLPGFIHLKGEPFQSFTFVMPKVIERYDHAAIMAKFKGQTSPLFKDQPPPAPGNSNSTRFTLSDVIGKGERNDTMYKALCSLRAHGLDDDAITAEAETINNERCHPPLGARELRTIIASACKHEPGPSTPELPEGTFVMPNDHVTYPAAAGHMFPIIAEAEDMFLHGDVISERVAHGLAPLTATSFQSRIDGYEKPVKRYIKVKRGSTSELVLVPTRCSKAIADVMMHTKEINRLPPVVVVVAAPVITPEGKTLSKGYHRDCGGIIVEGGSADLVLLDEAVPGLLGLFSEFDFVTPSDLSRALAMLLTPALKTAGLSTGPTPISFVEADASQAGKGYLNQITHAVYNERPYVISQCKGGVGGFDESFATGLLSGCQFMMFDNLRGALDSTALESMVTDPSNVRARKPYCVEAHVDASRVSLQATANAMKMTRDLANRGCVVRILKKPLDYQFKEYDSGDLLAHVRASQGFYLGCVHSVGREWIKRDKPLSDRAGHDMRQWARSLDYIVTEIMGLAPLMDGHLEIQKRVADANLVWLRAVCEVLSSGIFSASEIAAAGVAWPDKPPDTDKAGCLAVGVIMKKLFDGRDVLKTDQFTITRSVEEVFNENAGRKLKSIRYEIEDSHHPCQY